LCKKFSYIFLVEKERERERDPAQELLWSSCELAPGSRRKEEEEEK
jgi:hypothetical protein